MNSYLLESLDSLSLEKRREEIIKNEYILIKAIVNKAILETRFVCDILFGLEYLFIICCISPLLNFFLSSLFSFF